MTTTPKPVIWSPSIAAPLLAQTGGNRTTDIDGGTYVVVGGD